MRRPLHIPLRPVAAALGPLLALAACKAAPLPQPTAGAPSTSSTVADWSAFTLGPNDVVHVGIYGQPNYELPETGLRVAPDGSLSIPLLGPVDVSGKTPTEASVQIQEGLSQYLREFSVSVSVLEYSSRRYYLFGEVVEPGAYPMDRPITALEALSMGRGFEKGANREHATIVRRHPGDEVEVITFNAMTPGPDGLVQVLPDDLVFVGKAGVGVFSEDILPYLTGLGYSLNQIAAVTVAVRAF